MVMNRRNVLVGIALVAVVSGLALGSGAFTQVEATRNVELSTSGDSAALLQIEEGPAQFNITTTTTADSGVSVLELNEENLNAEALTRFEQSINVTNGGSQEVNLTLEDSAAPLYINETGTSNPIAGSPVTLSQSETVTLDIAIDLRNNSTNLPDEITFNATATSPP